MNFTKLVGVFLFLLITCCACHDNQVKVACIGDSLTFGSGVGDREKNSYPAIMARMLGSKYEVRNFGVSGKTIQNTGDEPYMREGTYREALAYQPDVVIIIFGSNDSKPHNWNPDNYRRDLKVMVNEFKKLPSNPQIYLGYPTKVHVAKDNINDSIISTEIIPIMDAIAQSENINVIKTYSVLENTPFHFADGVHPDKKGNYFLAEAIYRALVKK